MTSVWVPLPYEAWSATCDTLHAHTQVLWQLAAMLAPPEPQLQHAALRRSGRGPGVLPLPAPTGPARGSCWTCAATTPWQNTPTVERTASRWPPIAPCADVTRVVSAAVGELGGPVRIDPTPQETPWTVPLDEDFEHRTYDPAQVSAYFTVVTRGGVVLPRQRARSWAVDAGQRLVGDLRPRRRPLLGSPCRSAVQRLHHAQLGERRADRGRLVAR